MTPPLTPLERTLESTIGITAPILGFITSIQEQVEYGMRILSLLIGIVIGGISFYRMLKKPK
jgi:hypothetical protein